MNNVLTIQLNDGAFMPEKGRYGDAAFDLFSIDTYVLEPKKVYKIDTGVHIKIPDGFCGLVLPRSGMSIEGVDVKTGLIDSNYTGSIHVIMTTMWAWQINRGQRIGQILITLAPDWNLQEGDVTNIVTERNQNGFGSSGK